MGVIEVSEQLTNKAYRLSWLAIAAAVLSLLGSVALDRPDPSAAVMFLFFVCLPVSCLIGIGASLLAILGGKRAALLPLAIFLASVAYLARMLS